MRCLVTGVAGFVGSHLAERLLVDGHEVCGVDAFIGYYDRSLKERNLKGPRSWNSFKFVEGNLVNMPLLPLLEGVDWVFHEAAQAGVRASWGEEFARYTAYNVDATQRLLEAVQHLGCVKRMIYASSSSVYGDVRHTFADTRKARQLLDYRPRMQLIEGLAHEFEAIHNLYQRRSVCGAPMVAW